MNDKPYKPMSKREFLKHLRNPKIEVKVAFEIFPNVIEIIEVSKEGLERLIAGAEVSSDGEAMDRFGIYACYIPEDNFMWIGKVSGDEWEGDK